MESNVLKFINSAKKKLASKDFKSAYDELNTIIMFAGLPLIKKLLKMMYIGHNFEAYLYYGLCCKELKLYQEAERNLLTAVELKPNDINAIGQLYQVYQIIDVNKAYEFNNRLIFLMEKYLK